MMERLEASAGEAVTVRLVTLPKGTYVRFQPESDLFASEIVNPKAVYVVGVCYIAVYVWVVLCMGGGRKECWDNTVSRHPPGFDPSQYCIYLIPPVATPKSMSDTAGYCNVGWSTRSACTTH